MQELDKLALYVGASPQAPKELDHDAVDAVGAEMAGGDFLRLADLALGGRMDELLEELSRLPAGGSEAIPAVRSLQRRLLMLAPIARPGREGRSAICRHGVSRPGHVLEGQGAGRGDARAVERGGPRQGGRALRERSSASLIFSDAPQAAALGEELIAVARRRARRR